MTSRTRLARRHIQVLVIAALLGLLSLDARSEEFGQPVVEPDEAVTTRNDILRALHDVQTKYGSDTVMMQGHLLGNALRSGSILEATISVSGIEERGGKRFLGFKLETGIIYNDREVAAPQRTGRAFTEIIEASLRKFRAFSVPADGVVILLGYAHKAYTDEPDLRAHLSEGRGDPEAAAFYLLLADVSELIAERMSAQQLVDHSTILVNGTPAQVVLPLPTPSPSP